MIDSTDARMDGNAGTVLEAESAVRCGPRLSRRTLERACAFMRVHMSEPLTLDAIAAASHLSRSHFARAFRGSTGCSVMAYLYRLRVERAMNLLLQSDASIAELAAELGFSHQSHFTRVFRRITGSNPLAYRQEPGRPGLRPEQGYGSGSSSPLGVIGSAVPEPSESF